MPGRNCAFPQCTVSDYARLHGDIGILQITTRKSKFYSNWRKSLVNILSRYREIDNDFHERVLKGNVYLCERHFKPDEIEFTKTGRKTLKLGVVPTLNLPIKSHSNRNEIPRRHINIVKDATPVKENIHVYSSFDELCTRVTKLKIPWEKQIEKEFVKFTYVEKPYAFPKYELVVDESLEFSCKVFGWRLPLDNLIYKKHRRSVRHITISNLLKEILELNICKGTEKKHQQLVVEHSLPHNIDHYENDDTTTLPFMETKFFRSENCLVLLSLSEKEKCSYCEESLKKINIAATKFTKKINTPAKPNAPLSSTNPKRVALALKQERIKSSNLKKQIKQMNDEIRTKGISIDSNLSDDIQTIMNNSKNSASPFMNLFWKQQLLAHKSNPYSMKYHPMIIRFCLSLSLKSPSAYNELRSSNILHLPCLRTLRNYRNVVRPSPGFIAEVVQELKKCSENLSGYQRFIVLSFDEIKIQSDLVFDKHTGKLVGYVDLGDPDLNYSCFNDSPNLATHALVYYVRGLASDLKFPLAYFATEGLKSSQIFPTFWEAVAILEMECKLPVIAAVSDGASPNRKFMKMHEFMDNSIMSDVVYRTVNLFAIDRYIWFFADAPHLMKTTRNCMYHSGYGKTRLLWNNGKEIVWAHIVQIANDEMKRGLKLLPKISLDHTKLTSYSAMKVYLATQVLSSTVSSVIQNYYPEEMHGTAKLCFMMDCFFDCLNVRNQIEGVKKRKDFLLPFTSTEDVRFAWLKNTFLGYLKNWKTSVENRNGKFSHTDREKMFLSWQTYEGLTMTALSVIESTKFLLQNGMPFVLTEKFNQDVVEEYFGRQRSMGRRNDNPTIEQFGYNSNFLRVQRSIVPVTGNSKGKYKSKRQVSWYNVDNEPVPRKK